MFESGEDELVVGGVVARGDMPSAERAMRCDDAENGEARDAASVATDVNEPVLDEEPDDEAAAAAAAARGEIVGTAVGVVDDGDELSTAATSSFGGACVGNRFFRSSMSENERLRSSVMSFCDAVEGFELEPNAPTLLTRLAPNCGGATAAAAVAAGETEKSSVSSEAEAKSRMPRKINTGPATIERLKGLGMRDSFVVVLDDDGGDEAVVDLLSFGVSITSKYRMS
jgi:hypothetical protein